MLRKNQLIDLEQGSQAWLDFRKNMIGASDAPIIMGESPNATPYQLWQRKNGFIPEVKENEAMRRGKELEPIARGKAESILGYNFVPCVAVSEDNPWMIASYDGLDLEKNVIIEIKCPGQEDHQCALHGKVPKKYQAQLLHQMIVAKVESIIYFSFYHDTYKIVEFDMHEPDAQILIKKEKEFWDGLQNLDPPQLTQRDYNHRTDLAWDLLTDEWKELCEQIEYLESIKAKTREMIIDISQNKNCMGNGVKVQKIIRKGGVDYSTVPELIGVDLEKHRKPPIESWRIS